MNHSNVIGMSERMWVFGYGSLIWKVDFPYVEKIVGYIEGFQRRFYQHSTDHRGIPGKPGRVVTLLPGGESDKVYGIAYRIAEEERESVIDHLDFREKGGYERRHVIFHPKGENQDPFHIVVYLAKHDNPQYAGPADIDSIVDQILHSVGPSGSNVEYVLNLAKAMREIAPEVDDEHLFTIENNLKTSLDAQMPTEMDNNNIKECSSALTSLNGPELDNVPMKSDSAFLSAPWFHGNISREEAENLLQPHSDGLFLVRESTSFPGDYTLSVSSSKEIQNYRVKNNSNNFTIDDEEFFSNLEELVKHYMEHADGLCTRLVETVEKEHKLMSQDKLGNKH